MCLFLTAAPIERNEFQSREKYFSIFIFLFSLTSNSVIIYASFCLLASWRKIWFQCRLRHSEYACKIGVLMRVCKYQIVFTMFKIPAVKLEVKDTECVFTQVFQELANSPERKDFTNDIETMTACYLSIDQRAAHLTSSQ